MTPIYGEQTTAALREGHLVGLRDWLRRSPGWKQWSRTWQWGNSRNSWPTMSTYPKGLIVEVAKRVESRLTNPQIQESFVDWCLTYTKAWTTTGICNHFVVQEIWKAINDLRAEGWKPAD